MIWDLSAKIRQKNDICKNNTTEEISWLVFFTEKRKIFGNFSFLHYLCILN